MNIRDPQRYAQGTKKSQFILSGILLVCLLIVCVVLWWVYSNTKISEQNTSLDSTNDRDVSQPVPNDPPQQNDAPVPFDAAALQQAVDVWGGSLPASSQASVVVTDADGALLAALNPDEVYFAASLYKLFVAYEGYRAVDSAAADPAEIYQAGRTRQQCLDAMIRSSDSPCAEKMWVEIGKSEIDSTIEMYGIKNTSMIDITTTASDASIILRRIVSGEGLSEQSKAKYLDSMKTQDDLYRRGLPSGFSSELIVYNKVGWNEQMEYHDAAIVELKDGRKLIVAVLTNGVGTARIGALAAALEATF